MYKSQIYWCENCGLPLICTRCDLCKGVGESLTADLPVFAPEREIYLHESAEKHLTPIIPVDLFRFKNKVIGEGRFLFDFHVNSDGLEFNLKETLELTKFREDKDFVKRMLCVNQKTFV